MGRVKQSWVVVDLGFGDAGKGVVTDFLVRDQGLEAVVRFNGGAQAGHNVVLPDGRHHTFSQFGSGTFVGGTRSFLGPAFLLHPLGMEVEERHLHDVGVTDAFERSVVHAGARLITPYQQALNLGRERARGEGRHGTCGVGVGECVADALAGHPALHARDLLDARRVREVLNEQRVRKAAELGMLGLADALFDDEGLIERVVDAWQAVGRRLRVLEDDAFWSELPDRVAFEGAQGVLLDQDLGFHPHTTWSDCTGRGIRWGKTVRIGVTRTYQVRHGQGPLPSEGTVRFPEPHNGDGGPQGAFRGGALDGVLLRYAQRVCPVDGVAVTHLDRLAHGPVCTRWTVDGSPLTDLPSPGSLEAQQRLTTLAQRAHPVVEQHDLRAFIASAGAPIVLEGHGPTHLDVRWTSAVQPRQDAEGIELVP